MTDKKIPFGYCQCGCGQKTNICKRNDKSKNWIKGQPLRYLDGHSMLNAAREKAYKAIGNKSITSHGYVEITLGNGKQQYEHILIAEQVLGRKLKFISVGHPNNEVVHHIDGNKTNNSKDNLLLCTHSYHTALHHRLEQSDAWPEFPKVIRNTHGNKKANNHA